MTLGSIPLSGYSIIMSRFIRILMLTAFLSMLGFGLTESASACPGCKEALSNQSDEDGLDYDSIAWNPNYAYSYSVLFMLAVPAAILITFGTAAWRMTRKPTPPPPEQLEWDIDERA
jgi:hypothetical protein